MNYRISHRLASDSLKLGTKVRGGFLAAAIVVTLCGADWRQFRGNDGSGVAEDKGPNRLDKIAWTAPLTGRGLSGPIVVDGRVYITSVTGHDQDRLHVLAFNASDGSPGWERQFWATGRTQCHPKMSVAASQPASDGEHIVAFFSSNDVACLDRSGNLLWYRGLTFERPNATNSLGMASSPVIVGDTVVVQVETDDDSFATGIDIESGRTRWKLDRAHAANWTSPVILRGEGRGNDLVVLQSSKGLWAVRPQTGETVWKYEDGASTVSSSTVRERTLYVPSHGLTALDAAPKSGTPPQLWRKTQVSPGYSSPVFVDGRIYTIGGGPILIGVDAKTGDVAWRLRLKGTFYASPIAAAGRLYLFNDDGLAQIVQLGDKKGEIVSQHDFKEGIMCTPAISDGALYVRSDGHLWKIAD